ncbi:MAG TPA: ribosomal RNA small subunit methyltransferase A, partial [Candidatus Syntrophoarchaeum butanivorans]|nr:ribosomal RNA small subunit methyltransferase A [Candidatus Syntrophoarchaeum butanivorans]
MFRMRRSERTRVMILLEDHNIRPSPRKSQHFLVDEGILDRIVEYGDVGLNDRVLEIGAGVGSLTSRLLKRSEHVYAIEVDSRLSEILKERCAQANVINADALKIDLPEFDKVISNLPYSISSRITLKILKSGFKMGILMYQAEFVRRITAPPGTKEYGRLSVFTQALADVEILESVSRDAFYPRPDVHSVLIRLRPKEDVVENKDLFLEFITGLFSNRRKRLSKVLGSMGYDV